MQNGLQTTLDVLAATRNDTAGEVLLHALQQSELPHQKQILDAILRRRNPATLRKVVANWHTYCVELKEVAAEHRGRLAGAIRDAVVSRDDQLCSNGCDAALVTREYDIVPALLTVIHSSKTNQVEIASRTLIELVQSLYVQLNQTRDSRSRRDSELSHAHVSSALEAALRQFPQYKRKDVLTAFLLTARRDNATLKRVLREPLDPAHDAIVEQISESPRPAVARLATSFLEDARAPQAALSILSRRRDDLFIEHFLRTVGDDPSLQVRGNLKRLKTISWLDAGMSQLMFLDENAQAALAHTVGCSGVGHNEVMRVFKDILASGKLKARRAVASLLSEFESVEANRLVMQALRDKDVQVQATALGQLRERGLPGAMATLIEALDSDHALLRETARDCLSEFDVPRYLNAYEGMSVEVRRNTGQLVSKVDTNARKLLAEELQSASRSRRLRAIDVVRSLGMVRVLEDFLLSLLDDDDYLIRGEAAEALVECPTDKTRMALRNATLDKNAAVRTAAQRALDEMVLAGQQRTTTPDVAHIKSPTKVPGGTGGWTW